MTPPSDVLLVTCAAFPAGEPGGDLLVAELAARGLAARWGVWDDPDVQWDDARVVAVRSTWDYQSRPAEFLGWAATVPKLLNGAAAFAWNTDKSYLLDLAAAGLPVVPTVVARTSEDLEAAGRRWGPTVVKPTVGASGVGVVLAASGVDVGAGPWVVQPLVGSVRTEGEVSVFVLGGRVSTQVRKVPAGGEIRVQEQYGGLATAVPVQAEHASLARRAVRVAEQLLGVPLPYARVDLLRLDDGTLVLGELEIIEPGLYLDVVPDNAPAFAQAVLALSRGEC